MFCRNITLFLLMGFISTSVHAHDRVIDIINQWQRNPREVVALQTQRRLQDPDSAIIPGYTLIKPRRFNLKPPLEFPLPEEGSVYGNRDGLGVTSDKTNNEASYADIRRKNQRLVESTILQAIRNIYESNGDFKDDLIVLEISLSPKLQRVLSQQNDEEENNASELLAISSSEEENGRRTKVLTRHRYRDRSKFYNGANSEPAGDYDSDEESSSSDFEKNKDNPYSVRKDKYLQNFLWNHAMTGDHMNINPTAPKMKQQGPSAPELFFGRKWWYFNQDDYLPLR